MHIKFPEGTIPLVLTQEKAIKIWEKFNNIPGIFDDYSKDNPEVFMHKFGEPDSIWLETTDFPGIMYATAIRTGLSAHVHFAFFDSRLRGREEFLLNVLSWLVNVLHLEKVNAFVPGFCLRLINFLINLGFKKEGQVRNWSRNKGELFDVVILGMTKEEVYGRVFPTADERASGDKAESVVE